MPKYVISSTLKKADWNKFNNSERAM